MSYIILLNRKSITLAHWSDCVCVRVNGVLNQLLVAADLWLLISVAGSHTEVLRLEDYVSV